MFMNTASVLEKLEEIDAKLNVLVQESDPKKLDPKIEKVEKALEELRKEQAVTKNELQEMRRRTEAIQQNHQAIQALLARQAGTEALQAVFEARRVEDQAYEEVRRRHFDATAAYEAEYMARLRRAGQAGTEARQAGTEARQAGLEALQAGTEARRVDDQTFEEVMRKHCDANAAWGADFMARLWQDGQAGTEARQAGTEARQAGTEACQADTEARQQGGFDEALQESSLARMLALKRADQRRQARAEARQAEIEARQAATEARQARLDNPLGQTMAHMNSFGGYKQAGQVGTEARQAATEARQARTDNPLAQTMALVNSLGGQRQAIQADQANQAGKRRGGPGRPVGVKRDAKEEDKPKRKPVWPEAYGPSTFGEIPPSVAAYFKQQQEAFQKAQEAMLFGQSYPSPLRDNVVQLAAKLQHQYDQERINSIKQIIMSGQAAPPPSPFLHDLFKAASVYKPLWEDHGLVKLPERTSSEKMAFNLATRVKELEAQHMQDEETIASCRAKMDKNDTLKEENDRLKAQLANFKDAFGIEEHKLQFDMDELKEKMVGAQVADEPSTSSPAPRQETSDEDDFEKVQEDEEKEEEKMEEDA